MSDSPIPNPPVRQNASVTKVDPVEAYAKKLEGLTDKQLAGEVRRRIKSGERLFLTSVLDIIFNSTIQKDRAYIK
jgi:hypothetical protein